MICLAVMTIFTSRGQAGKVVVDAKITDLPADSLVFWRALGSDSRDSVKTVKGGFHFEIPIKPGEGNIYIVQVGRKYVENSMELLYLDEGKITITGKGPLFADSKLAGSPYVVQYNDYRKNAEESPALSGQKEIYAKANELYKNNDTVALAALQPKLDQLDSIRTALAKQWVSAHPSSPISAFVLYFHLRNNLSSSALDAALSKLTASAKNNIPAKNLANSIQVERETAVGKPARDFTQTDTLGKAVSLKDFRGKYVLLDFWASWCQPCRMENPNVVAAFKKFSPKNFTVLSVSLDQAGQKEKWMKAIHDDGLTWTHISDLKFWNNAVAKLYDIQSIPSNLLIDPTGNIVARNLHGDELDKKLSELLLN